jgi:hypothetical protein
MKRYLFFIAGIIASIALIVLGGAGLSVLFQKVVYAGPATLEALCKKVEAENSIVCDEGSREKIDAVFHAFPNGSLLFVTSGRDGALSFRTIQDSREADFFPRLGYRFKNAFQYIRNSSIFYFPESIPLSLSSENFVRDILPKMRIDQYVHDFENAYRFSLLQFLPYLHEVEAFDLGHSRYVARVRGSGEALAAVGSLFEKGTASFLAVTFPTEAERALPDKTRVTELLFEPERFVFSPCVEHQEGICREVSFPPYRFAYQISHGAITMTNAPELLSVFAGYHGELRDFYTCFGKFAPKPQSVLALHEGNKFFVLAEFLNQRGNVSGCWGEIVDK